MSFFEDELVEDEAVEEESVEEESVEEEAVTTTSHEVITTLDAANFAPFTGKDLIVKKVILTIAPSISCSIREQHPTWSSQGCCTVSFRR